jgi:hypothetical protein
MLPKIQDIVIESLVAKRDQREGRESVLDGLHARVSSAGKCARAIGLSISGLEASDPISSESLMNFAIGDFVHDVVQSAIVSKWPDAQLETVGTIGDYLEGHSDVLYSAEDGQRVVLEIKSIADFGFKLATGVKLKSNGQWNKKDQVAEGPKRDHLSQAAIYGVMHGAAYISIVYVRKTAAKDEPITWEWRYEMSALRGMADVEIQRLKQIVELVRDNRMPDREYEGKIIDPLTTKKFPCSYCSYRSACVRLGVGEVQIS